MSEHGQEWLTPLPIAPSLQPVLAGAGVERVHVHPSKRLVRICILAGGIAVLAALAASALGNLIALITNLSWYGHWSLVSVAPDPHVTGWLTMVIPAAGGLVVGLMARFGSPAIRGHGIPEAMQQVLENRSRIAPRLVVLKPLSSAIAIGTGGPFGAEGPIIATGGALGSVFGQLLRVTANERKILLAAGAAAGMAATFGTPFSAVLLVIELLLFEFHVRSFVPVAIAVSLATGIRGLVNGSSPAIVITASVDPSLTDLMGIVVIGVVAGIVAAAVTRAVYLIEDSFAKLPIHWMWWPALGGLVVGIAGMFEPRALGIGYGNLTDIADGRLIGIGVISLLIWKSLAWMVALGSGTSGGTLAPLLTIGACVGMLLAKSVHVPVAEAALCGMAAVFAGSSHAILASAVFVAEASQRPLVGGVALLCCVLSWLVANRLTTNSIMVEKIARRGVRVPGHLSEHATEPVESARLRLYPRRSQDHPAVPAPLASPGTGNEDKNKK